jgi:hypothetical protein
LYHSLVGSPQDLDVGSTKRKLGRPDGGGTRFDFIDPIEKLTHRGLIAASGLRRELHRRTVASAMAV